VRDLVAVSSEVDSPLAGWGNAPYSEQLYPLNKSTIAYANSLVVKTGPGILYGFTVYSSNAGAQFIQVFDATTLPADGAVPMTVFTVGATSNLGVNWIPGRTFHSGIVLCNSSTGATKTVGSADTWFDAQFL
jgi:hypothetical protein